MRYGKASHPRLSRFWITGLLALAVACNAGSLLASDKEQPSPDQATASPAAPANFAHYRDTRAGFEFDYPRQLELNAADRPHERDSDARVLSSDALTLRVSTTARGGRSLRALAVDTIGDPSAASETRNTAGSVVLVQDDESASRAVKAIALAQDRAAIMIVEGASAPQRDAILSSFVPVSAAVSDPAETDAEARYRNPQLGFSIERPKGARVSRDGDDTVSFKVLGPANAAASEISDGFVLTVTRDRKPGIDTLAEYAEAVRADGAPSANSVKMGDYTALQYTTQTEMGDTVSHWLYRLGERRQYQVTATVSGEHERYREQIQTMLKSLLFD
jgi:hypothetical protein